MTTPLLKQFGDLRPDDFRKFPVWVSCHVIDYDESWYGETDEETFRPWLGDLPVDPAQTMFLLRAEFRIADGRSYEGFITPAEADDLGLIQPQIFLESRRFGFWGGMVGVPEPERAALYEALAVSPEAAFPIAFNAQPGLGLGVVSGSIEGFYRKPNLSSLPVVER